MILQEVKEKNATYFSESNRKFFGDIRYSVQYGGKSGERFLVRSTYAWSDMFGEPKRLHYRVNRIKEDLTLGELLPDVFDTLPEVRRFLKTQ